MAKHYEGRKGKPTVHGLPELWMKVRVLLVLVNCKQLFWVIWSHHATEPKSIRIILLQIIDGLIHWTILITIQKKFCYARSPAMDSTAQSKYHQTRNMEKNSLSAHHFILLYSLKKKYYSRLGAKANASIWLCKLTEISPQQDPQPKPFRWTRP
jgi:hypothetical protein